MDIQEGAQKHTVPLLLHLTSERDKNGSTPLHFAASLETGSSYYSRVSEKFWPKPRPTTLLLEANESMVYQPDNEGSYPIHVAACNRRLKAVKILLRRCPECATLRDKRGKTFLHVAVDKKRYDVVKFAAVRAEFASLLNEQDKQGDTALHLAVKVGSLSIFNVLFRNRHVCLDLLNRDGLTPRDISWIMIPAGFYNKKVHYWNLSPVRLHLKPQACCSVVDITNCFDNIAEPTVHDISIISAGGISCWVQSP